MVRVLQKQNILLIYSKHFLYFEWKLEESDLEVGNELRSPEFNLGGEEKSNSFLEFRVPGSMCFDLHNPKPLANGYYVLTIIDKMNSVIKSITGSTDSFATSEKVDLFGAYGKVPSSKDCPIIVTCTLKSSINDHFSVFVNDKKIMKEISIDLKNVLDAGLNTDIELISDEKSIKAHKIILQARSPVFRKMFEHDSSESSKNTVDISDIGSSTVKRLVNFLYTGIMDKCDFEEVMELYYAADKYEVISLREDCKPVLLKHLDVENACRLFTLASRHNDEGLKEKIVQFVSAHFTPVVSSESMHEMSKEDVIMLTRLCATAGIKQ